jgi:Kef-type K+ transport system membrane component KefB
LNPEYAFSLLLISAGAFIVPMISRRIGIPSAVGEIIYGMLFGPYFIRGIQAGEFIQFLAQLGFAILLFSAGLEINFHQLRRSGPGNLAAMALVLMLVLGMGTAAWFIFKMDAFMLLALGSVSVALPLVFLRERGLEGGPFGQTLLSVSSLGEVGTIMILTVMSFYFKYGLGQSFANGIAKFLVIFVLAYILVRIFRFLIWWFPKSFARLHESDNPIEPGVRFSFALLFIFLALAAYLEIEAILGAFLAGMLFAVVFPEREVILDKLKSIGQGFFIPFFFIVVGTEFDPRLALQGANWSQLLLLLGVALAIKLVPCLMLLVSGLRTREFLAAGFMLAAPLTLMVAIAELGLELERFSTQQASIIILLAIITGIFYPLFSRLLLQSRDSIHRTQKEGLINQAPTTDR